MIVSRLVGLLCLVLGTALTRAESVVAQHIGSKGQDPFDCAPMLDLLSTMDSRYSPSAVPDYAKGLLLKAKKLDKSAISSVGGYFREGSRGLSRDEHYGFCMIYRNFRGGYAPDAYEVAKKYAALGKVSEAARYYGVAFGYSAVSEALDYQSGLDDPLEADFGVSHIAFSGMHDLIAKQLISDSAAFEQFQMGRLMGIGMTADLQRINAALRELR